MPLTTGRSYPFRPSTRLGGTAGVAAIDQLSAVDKRRLTKRLGAVDNATAASLLRALDAMFQPE